MEIEVKSFNKYEIIALNYNINDKDDKEEFKR